MTRDATLRPLLAVTLAVTVASSALTLLAPPPARPPAVSVVPAVWVYRFVYGVCGGHGTPMADHMAEDATSPSTSFSGSRLVAVWLGLAVLMGSQIWDLVDVRRRGPVDQAPCSDAVGL